MPWRLRPTAKRVATGSSDRAGGYLRLWDAASGQTVRRLEGHTDAVTSVHFSRDGKRLLSSSYDATARLWNVETGELIRTFAGHDWWVWSAAFSPDERRIVTASHDGSAIVWTTDTGEPHPVPFLGHRKDGSQTPVFTAVFAPDGRRVASGGLDNCVLIWDPDELQPFDYARAIAGQKPPPQPFVTLAGHKAAVHALAFSQDGKRLVSGSHDNAVIVWDAETGAMIKTLRGHDGWVQACSLTGDGRLAVSASHDGRVKFWDVQGYEEARVLRGHVLAGHLDAVLAAAYSPDGRRVATASRDRTAKSWDASTGAELLQFREGHEFTTATATFFPDGKRLLTTAIDNTTRIWDVATGGELADLRLQGTGLRGAAAVSHDGRWIVTGSQRPQQGDAWAAKLWSAADGKLVHEWQGHKTEVSAVAFSPDDRLAFSGDRNGRGVLWNRETGEQIATLWEDDQINAAAFLPDGQHLLTASNHNAVRQWQIPAGTEIKERVLRHPAAVVSLAVSGDGRLALTACADGVVRLWDVAGAKEIRSLAATGGRAAFAQNLRRRMQDYRWTAQQAAAQCQVSEALLRDLLTAKTQATPELAEKLAGVFNCRPGDLWKTVFSVAIAPDGKTGLTVAADDRQVRLWNLADGSEVLYPAAADRLGPFLDLTGGLFRGLVWAAEFSPQGDRIVTVGGDSARLWDLRKDVAPRNRELMSFSPHGAVASAEFSPDGKYLVTGSWDTSARVWDAQTGQVIRQLGVGLDQPQQEHRGRVNRAAFSPDGRMVVTASDDGTAKLWSTADWTLLRTLTGHTGAGPARRVLARQPPRPDRLARQDGAHLGRRDRTVADRPRRTRVGRPAGRVFRQRPVGRHRQRRQLGDRVEVGTESAHEGPPPQSPHGQRDIGRLFARTRADPHPDRQRGLLGDPVGRQDGSGSPHAERPLAGGHLRRVRAGRQVGAHRQPGRHRHLVADHRLEPACRKIGGGESRHAKVTSQNQGYPIRWSASQQADRAIRTMRRMAAFFGVPVTCHRFYFLFLLLPVLSLSRT